jgi:hypothetical protein
MIALAYLYNKQLVVEDLIAIGGRTVWQNLPFIERWKRLKHFLEHEFRNDSVLQDGLMLSSTAYFPLAELVEPPPDKVVEFVACNETGPVHKRLLWIPPRDTPASGAPAGAAGAMTGGSTHVAKRESAMGPDVYSLYGDGDKKLGIALVRTLVASKALRLAFSEVSGDATVRVVTAWNKQFDKWEILDVRKI